MGEKSYEKFKKVAVRKSHGKGVEAPNFFRIRSQFRGRTTPKMKFLLKILALPEGGGSRFLQKLQKKSILLPAVISLLKISKVRKIEFLQFLQEFQPPPLWESHNSEKKIHFRGRSTSEFSLNWELFRTFTPVPRLFRKATFLNFS